MGYIIVPMDTSLILKLVAWKEALDESDHKVEFD